MSDQTVEMEKPEREAEIRALVAALDDARARLRVAEERADEAEAISAAGADAATEIARKERDEARARVSEERAAGIQAQKDCLGNLAARDRVEAELRAKLAAAEGALRDEKMASAERLEWERMWLEAGRMISNLERDLRDAEKAREEFEAAATHWRHLALAAEEKLAAAALERLADRG